MVKVLKDEQKMREQERKMGKREVRWNMSGGIVMDRKVTSEKRKPKNRYIVNKQ